MTIKDVDDAPHIQTLAERNVYDRQTWHIEVSLAIGSRYWATASYDKNSLKAAHDALLALVGLINQEISKDENKSKG